MPIITFAGGKLTGQQKAELVEQFTEAAHKTTDIHKDAFVVIIRESALEHTGAGGEFLADRNPGPSRLMADS